ncbi:phosphoenolpyruvate synthase [bacterium (Candidatus Gribaldobacteria) CG_4_8_14_3_um_filter_42_11]|uniref:Phosphoenolpyruvate synthase n=1 Tax=bacterium (Candidatus Gribaldobacteria) CG_4_8_14_3_um_filter_42_11 TaxID=2014267 RepID=A0A2M7IYL3_9BACT|nr:MAG: phosphoenolpyruvate synthase [bacterium (Candidatus Gribaldobacteria) CG_4_8_14_3_um_filter_42_11]
MEKKEKYILWFSEINKDDGALVGGKNASLGEMYNQLNQQGVRVPNGFALTASAYWYFLKFNHLDEKLAEVFSQFNRRSLVSLAKTGQAARRLILQAKLPPDLAQQIREYYRELSQKSGQPNITVAVRSSATAEDLKGASFAGAMETYLNITGEANLLTAIQKCISSLFTDRSIAYREEKGFDHLKIALSAGVLQMVRSDLGSSGVMFTLDTETGFRDIVLINSIYGVGEMIVKGHITPDEFIVFKPCLKDGFRSIVVKNLGQKKRKYIFRSTGGLKEAPVTMNEQKKFSLNDDDVLTLAKWAVKIEEHYNFPQDIEWAKDGKTNKLFILQSRPETVETEKNDFILKEFVIQNPPSPLLQGIAIGGKVASGKARVIKTVSQLPQFERGEILITKMTDPDWVPAIRLASAVITDEGSRVCHAAIVSRELGIPCVVATGKASKVLRNGQMLTVDCSSGLKGNVYSGKVLFETKEYNLKEISSLPARNASIIADAGGPVKIMVNIGEPGVAFKTSFLPVDGVGLAREEFIIAEKIRVHPLALYDYEKLKRSIRNSSSVILSQQAKNPGQEILRPDGLRMTSSIKAKVQKIIKEIDEITIEHQDKKEFFVKELAEGVGQVAAAFWPKPVILRFSDFKTNEYRALVGGELYEPLEENPMIGWRGASRYYDEKFKPAFLMECEAIKRVRDVFGLKNLKLMIPFCRTVEEGKKVLEIMRQAGLERGQDGLEVFVMCEIPSNVIMAEQFLEIFDGMSIGSNDLTQLTLGLDRDNGGLAYIGNENNEAVKELLKKVIKVCREKGKYCGICGDAPSSFPDFANFLMDCGIESISLSPDAVIKTILQLSREKGQTPPL